MPAIPIKAVHHLALTVSDLARAKDFYQTYLGFQVAADMGERLIMNKDSILLAIGLAPDKTQAIENDQFSPHRIGLDHLSFSVDTRAQLEEAKLLFEADSIDHRYVKELEAFGICVLAFKDPDGIALELTSPM